jgi:hypothetical protein
MSILFLSFSAVNLMIDCLLIYQIYHELFVIYNFLVLVWIWLHACLSYDPGIGLVKLILYHVNFVTIQKPNQIDMAGLSDVLKPEWFAGVTTSTGGRHESNSGSCR